MDVEVRAALQFKTRAALDKAIVAFDDNGYRGFFTSDMWKLAGPFALCESAFEIEVDCDYNRAFRAMAKTAVDGIIEFRDRREKGLKRLVKQPTGWAHVPAKTFGKDTAKLVKAWAKPLAAASLADAAIETKAAKKGTSVVIETKINLVAGAVLTDGTIAIASPRRVMFFTAAGKKLGEQTWLDEEYADRITDLYALPDNKVIAYNRERNNAIGVVSKDGFELFPAKPTSSEDRLAAISCGVARANDVTAVWGDKTVYVLEKSKLRRLGTVDDYIYSAMPWRDGVFACTLGKLTFFTLGGRQQWTVAANGAIATEDGLITADFDTIALRKPTGKSAKVIESSPGRAPSYERERLAWLVEGDSLFVANRATEEWNRVTGKPIASVQTHGRLTHLCGLLRVAGMTVTWADRPVHPEDRDSHVVFVRGKDIVDQFDAKADVLEGINVGSDAIAVRTKAKIFVWRAGKVQVLGGHKKAAAGFMALPDGRLVSWSGDTTIRIWTL